jgi:hypothetical protein
MSMVPLLVSSPLHRGHVTLDPTAVLWLTALIAAGIGVLAFLVTARPQRGLSTTPLDS